MVPSRQPSDEDDDSPTFPMHHYAEARIEEEYALPRPRLADDVLRLMGPWMTQIANSSMGELRNLLDERWKSVECPTLLPLKEQLIAYEPISIVRARSEVYLRLLMPDGDPELIGASAYIPELNIDMSSRGSKCQQFDLGSHRDFVDFLDGFGGLAEDLESPSRFIDWSGDWNTNAEEDDWIYSARGALAWRDSIVFYHALNGDALLFRKNGAIGWWVCSEHVIFEQATSFREFIEYYVDYRKTPWPLDSYGPSS